MSWMIPYKKAVSTAATAEKSFANKVKAFREATGTPERFMVVQACAKTDRPFVVTFERFDEAKPFRVASIEKFLRTGGSSTAARLRLLPSAHIDLGALICPWCGDDSGIVNCDGCSTVICRGRVIDVGGESRFTCRESCGVSNARLTAATTISGADAQAPRTFGTLNVAGRSSPALPRGPAYSELPQQRLPLLRGQKK